MSDELTPPLYECIRHVALSVVLAVMLLNQALVLDAVAPDALVENAETIWIAAWLIVAYGLLPFVRFVVNLVGRIAGRRFAGGETA